MTFRSTLTLGAVVALGLAGAPAIGLAAGACGSAATHGATQGGGLGPSCEGQQPTTGSAQATTPGMTGAGSASNPGGSTGIGGVGGSGSAGGGHGGGGAGGAGGGGGSK